MAEPVNARAPRLNRFAAENNRGLRGTPGEVPSYTEAQWNGLEFWIESSSDEFGRRGDVYEYPLGNEIGYKDLGRKARHYKIEGYLLGTNQDELTRDMVREAERSEPGKLDHPLFGANLPVACVSLTVTADYRRDKKRTKLAFEFIEASPSLGALQVGKTIEQVWADGAKAAEQAQRDAMIDELTDEDLDFSDESNVKMIQDINDEVAQLLPPIAQQVTEGLNPVLNPGAEQILDAKDILAGGGPISIDVISQAMTPFQRSTLTREVTGAAVTRRVTFASLIGPIDYASSVIRAFSDNALERLRAVNEFVVNRQEGDQTAQMLIKTIRLIILRDYAVAASMKNYETSRDAIADLDFIIAAYDDEEALATQHCDDVLVNLIYRARASAASAILARAIQLPGIAEYPVDGVWPSVVCSWKLYADSRRHEIVERYNPGQSVFFMGRDVVAPAR